LRVENRSIGLLAFSDSRPRRFTDTQRHLARLLGSQAAVIVANSRLYEQSLRDARTNAVLLRELHHRVKNALAGIVGLLSMHEPDLPASARRRPDRIVERIRTMAQAHDLFREPLDSVNLHRLVESVLASLAVIPSQNVRIRTELADSGVLLPSAQAIGLALILHELCSNALFHALPGGGNLTIRSRCDATTVAIDVIDDGRGLPADLSPDDQPASLSDASASAVTVATAIRQHGMGLMLVRELAGRELRGSFRISRSPDGLTIATVEFPRNNEHLEGVAS